MTAAPTLTRHPDVLAWDVPAGWVALSSAAVGGGLLRPRWVLNAGVGDGFSRTDLATWSAEVAGQVGLTGRGCALLTAADVSQVQHAEVEGVLAWATVGVTKPTWPVRTGTINPATLEPGTTHPGSINPGTINIVVTVPVPLSGSALVQALGTITGAKAQVLVQAGVPGTGTASDAVVVLCPESSLEAGAEQVPFAGVRSPWGAVIARAVHDAVATGLAAHPWPAADVDPTVIW
ncbi:adenosylcobinamide amidohydrolase [Ornithinimicrobium sp. Y1694]|uniref:adenosylcobinamide amidohydrolase n=1 Tax=Ornithinimicrobium sp. Y1694 TaxID=3418590 RepID=UPI003CE906A3